MYLRELIRVTDPNGEGNTRITLKKSENEDEMTAAASSAFFTPFERSEVLCIQCTEKDQMTVWTK